MHIETMEWQTVECDCDPNKGVTNYMRTTSCLSRWVDINEEEEEKERTMSEEREIWETEGEGRNRNGCLLYEPDGGELFQW